MKKRWSMIFCLLSIVLASNLQAAYDSVSLQMQNQSGEAQTVFMFGEVPLVHLSIANIDTNHARRIDIYDSSGTNLLWFQEDSNPVPVSPGQSLNSIWPYSLSNARVASYLVRAGVKEEGELDFTYEPGLEVTFTMSGNMYYSPTLTVTDSEGTQANTFLEGDAINFSLSASSFSADHQTKIVVENSSGTEIDIAEGDFTTISSMFLQDAIAVSTTRNNLSADTYTVKAYIKLDSLESEYVHDATADLSLVVNPGTPPPDWENPVQVLQNSAGQTQNSFNEGDDLVSYFSIDNAIVDHRFMERLFASDGVTVLREKIADDYVEVLEGNIISQSFYRYPFENVSAGSYIIRSYVQNYPSGEFLYEEGSEQAALVTGPGYANPSLLVANSEGVAGTSFYEGDNIYFQARYESVGADTVSRIEIRNSSGVLIVPHSQSDTVSPSYLNPELLHFFYNEQLPVGTYTASLWFDYDGAGLMHLDTLDYVFDVVDAPVPPSYNSPTLLLLNDQSQEVDTVPVGGTITANFSIYALTVPCRFKIVVFNNEGVAIRTNEAVSWVPGPTGNEGPWAHVPYVIDFSDMPVGSGVIRGYVQTDAEGDFVYHEGTEKVFTVEGDAYYNPRLEVFDESYNLISETNFPDRFLIRLSSEDISSDLVLRFMIRDYDDNIIRNVLMGNVNPNLGELRNESILEVGVDNLAPGSYVVEAHISSDGSNFVHITDQDYSLSVNGEAYYSPSLSVTDQFNNPRGTFASNDRVRLRATVQNLNEGPFSFILALIDSDGIPQYSVESTSPFNPPAGAVVSLADFQRDLVPSEEGLEQGVYNVRMYVRLGGFTSELSDLEQQITISEPVALDDWEAQICVNREGVERCFDDENGQNNLSYILANENISAKLAINGVRVNHRVSVVVRRGYGNIIDWDGGWRTVPSGEYWVYETPLIAKADEINTYTATFMLQLDGVSEEDALYKQIPFVVSGQPPEEPPEEPPSPNTGLALPFINVLLLKN